MNNTKVILAGAGPGDPELISLKALRYLKSADVILIDRLVSPELIELYASKTARVVYVGKQCSKGIHTPQAQINDLMVSYAQLGLKVLRLKGGDVSIFSNILDELTVLKKHNINYEIIPGISAALGAAAYSGIPLTSRGYSRAVRFLTLCDTENIAKGTWQDLAQTQDTLVFYMSGQKLKYLVNSLINNGIAADKGIAVIQQASTIYQRTTVYSFKDLQQQQLIEFEYVPTLFIVGKVVELHNKFSWKQEIKTREIHSYFDNHIKEFQHAI